MTKSLASLTLWLAAFGLVLYFVIELIVTNLLTIAAITAALFLAWIVIRRLANGSPYRGDGLY